MSLINKLVSQGFILLGRTAVDSGQLMVCDPCYLSKHWKRGENHETPKAPVYQHQDGRKFFCTCHGSGSEGSVPFSSFEDIIDPYGKTMNQLRAAGECEELVEEPSGEFSYRGCCEVTCGSVGGGQLLSDHKGEGAGVAFASGYGDGVYSVLGRLNSEGRIVEVRILMDCDEEDED